MRVGTLIILFHLIYGININGLLNFLIKVEDNFRPNIEIFEHDFTESSLKLSLKYNSAYLVKSIKNNKIKRRNTIQFKFIGNFDI